LTRGRSTSTPTHTGRQRQRQRPGAHPSAALQVNGGRGGPRVSVGGWHQYSQPYREGEGTSRAPARLVVRLAIQVGIVEDLRAAARQREIDPARGNGGWIRAVPFPPACTALMNLNADSCHLLEAGAGDRCLCTPSSVQTLLTAWLVPGRFSDWASVVLALVFNLLILGRHKTKWCALFFFWWCKLVWI